MSNYPDDIRSYDHDPRSPFYEGGRCPACGMHDDDCECTDEERQEAYDNEPDEPEDDRDDYLYR